jgi:predicted metal-dependent peptidase
VEPLKTIFLVGLLAHEALHIVLMHHIRRGSRIHKLWNAACDYIINEILIGAGFHLPPGFLFDKRFSGMSVEQVYDILFLEQERPKEEPQKPSDEPQEGEPGDDNQDGQESQEGPSDDPGDDSGEGDEGEESQTGDPGKCGEVRDAPSETGELSEAEINEIESKVKVQIAQAVQLQEKISGKMPGSMGKVVGEILDPEIPWYEAVWRYLQMTAKNDFSMKRPNWNFLGTGDYLPSMLSNEIEGIVLAVDTSCSQQQADLNACLGAIETLLEQIPTTLTVIHCDTEVEKVETFTSQDLPIKSEMEIGGGTDFRPPFEWVAEQGIMPTVFIYLTDGECSKYPEEPGYPVLWIGTREPFQPPFGELIMMNRR